MYNGLGLCETGGKTKYLFIKQNGSVKVVLKGRRQGRKAQEVLRFLNEKKIDGSKLDGRFFAVLSVYLCEEKDINSSLLLKEIRRFL
jgi:hypothetical protein